jgi:hypothetical protein
MSMMPRRNTLIDEIDNRTGIRRTLVVRPSRRPRLNADREYWCFVRQVGHVARHKVCMSLRAALDWLTWNHLPGAPCEVSAAKEHTSIWFAKDHRDIILQVAGSAIRQVAFRRAHKILSQTGSFTYAIEDEALSSLARFTSGLKHARKTEEREAALRQARNSKTPKNYQTSDAPSDSLTSVWAEFEPFSPEPRPSLRIDIASDAPEDVAAEVMADLVCQSPPCRECGRLFSLVDFFRQADEVAKTREQRERLSDLRTFVRLGKLRKACPMLWHYIGVRPRQKGRADENGKRHYILPQTGALAPEADEYDCRLQALAGHYAWRASQRYAYRAARRGAFVDSSRQQSDGKEIHEEESQVVVWSDQQVTPEDLVIKCLSDRQALHHLRSEIRSAGYRVDFTRRLLIVLDLLRESGVWPTSSEVAVATATTDRTGRNLLTALANLINQKEGREVAIA